MSLVVYAPSLALELVIGINYRLMVAIIFIVCIFYSSIGGFKAVLWTDSLQAVIMVVSMGVVVIVGTSKLGGFSEVWRMADETKRLNFFKSVSKLCHELEEFVVYFFDQTVSMPIRARDIRSGQPLLEAIFNGYPCKFK